MAMGIKETTRLTKCRIRSRILRELKTHKEEEQKRKSRIIRRKLLDSSVFKKARTVMFYLSFGGEVNTKEMIRAAKKLGKIVTVPVCDSHRRMRPCILTDTVRLKIGPYGVREPALQNPINIKDLDLAVIPGLAFDKEGRRLGRGKGCYDYFLKKLPKRTVSIGLAYDFQILPVVPTTKRDISVNRILFA